MSIENVKSHTVAARSETNVSKKLDLIACAIEELAEAFEFEFRDGQIFYKAEFTPPSSQKT